MIIYLLRTLLQVLGQAVGTYLNKWINTIDCSDIGNRGQVKHTRMAVVTVSPTGAEHTQDNESIRRMTHLKIHIRGDHLQFVSTYS
jgi:hypothetical protein